ncbi:MAG: VanW family protein [Clostridia bacterium]|nr:VanW family protein [Clostridia bacterium]
MAETMKKSASAAERAASAVKRRPDSAAAGQPGAAKRKPRAAGAAAKSPSGRARPVSKGAAAKRKRTAAAKAVSVNKAASATKAVSAKKTAGATKAAPAKKTARTAKTAATGTPRTRRVGAARREALNPVATEADRRHAAPKRRAASDDLFMERVSARRQKGGGAAPPKKRAALFGALNLCLIFGIVMLAAFGIRQQVAYAEFKRMRDVVDQQTFYEGTTIEGVDVSGMTLANAMEYWRDRVEARNENRTVAFDDGTTVTAKALGYTSDYESVLSAAWSAGRSGSLEERYQKASSRAANPVAYQITRMDYSDAILEQYVAGLAKQVDRPAQEASIASFDASTYEFVFNEAQSGRELDQASLRASIAQTIQAGGGNVALPVAVLEPRTTTEEVAAQYGLIDYAITNASSSSKARLNNISLAMSFINGTCVEPGETFSFNDAVGERTTVRGFRMATAYSGGEVTEQVGGGICQVSTTLFNAAVKADMEIVERHNHSLTVHYVDKGKDATVDWGHQDFKFKNTSEDNIYICCYLTDDKRVRFGVFGKLLPNGEKITLEAVTTETIKPETEYQASAFLGPGETYVLQPGRTGYKAEAYKIRWDAAGTQLSKELLCKSVYKVKNEIIQYGA